MAYTSDQLDSIITTLESRLSKGTAEIQHQGERIVYRSTSEIVEALNYFKTKKETLTTRRTRQIRLYSTGS